MQYHAIEWVHEGVLMRIAAHPSGFGLWVSRERLDEPSSRETCIIRDEDAGTHRGNVNIYNFLFGRCYFEPNPRMMAIRDATSKVSPKSKVRIA